MLRGLLTLAKTNVLSQKKPQKKKFSRFADRVTCCVTTVANNDIVRAIEALRIFIFR